MCSREELSLLIKRNNLVKEGLYHSSCNDNAIQLFKWNDMHYFRLYKNGDECVCHHICFDNKDDRNKKAIAIIKINYNGSV